jgi:acyl-CoA thioesterase-1
MGNTVTINGFNKLKNLCFLGLTCMLLTGCGGGGGSGSSGAGDTPNDPLLEMLRGCGAPERALRIMPLGDSITEAETGHNSYRRQLWKALQAAGCSVDFVGSRRGVSRGFRDSAVASPPSTDFDLDHEGHWDYTTDEIFAALPAWYAANPAEVVLIHLGSNDIFRDQGVPSTLSDLDQVLERLQLANPRVVILLARIIPSASRSAEIQTFNAALDALVVTRNSSQHPVRLVDMYSDFSPAQDLYDGVHPNASGEGKLADRFANALLQVLAEI